MARAVRNARKPVAESAAPAPDQRLWAPWRYPYVRGERKRESGCIFCPGDLDSAARRDRLILYLGRRSLVMLNAYPYNNGHVMVAPRRHAASPELLESAERGELAELVSQSVTLLRTALNPDGFNLGANLGVVGGAGFADHLHWHVVPRWAGDNNFMPVLASTRVLSQHLLDSYDQLHPLFKEIKAGLS